MRLRNMLVLSGAVALAACGGDSRPQTVGGAPVAGGGGGGGGTPTPTQTHSFVSPTDTKTYEGLGAVQHYEYFTDSNKSGQGGQLYAGDANTVRDSAISVSYNPRDAIFELAITRPKGLVNVTAFRFQDPMHRTAFGGPLQPQAGVPNFDAARNIQYLEAGSQSGAQVSPTSPYYPGTANSDYPVLDDGGSSSLNTFFYQKPGTTTKYVTYAGFVRNGVSGAVQSPDENTEFLRESYNLDRAAFVFGERTGNSAVPKSGSGTFGGEMIASMVVNVDPTSRADATGSTYLQWMQGRQDSIIDFAALTVKSTFTGTLLAATRDAYTDGQFALPASTAFSAEAAATIDMINRGGFTGSFNSACFAAACTAANALVIAGSSIDGAFFGPNGEEIGGGFRIVGGTPDQRIDILGAFVGKKP